MTRGRTAKGRPFLPGEGATRDLEHYLRHSTGAEDRGEIENHLKELRRIRATMN